MVRAQIPPDLRAVGNAARPHQRFDEILVLVEGIELRWYPGAREARPDGAAVRLEPGDACEPEGARRRNREEVLQAIARLVQDVDEPIAIQSADVDMDAA